LKVATRTQIKRRGRLGLILGIIVAAVAFAAVAYASDVAVAVVDVTIPSNSVTLASGGSAPITINMSVSGAQAGTATFEVYRNWTLSGGVFAGSNPQEFTVGPRAGGDPATTFSTSGTVTVASGQSPGTFTLAHQAFDITNSNATGAKLAAGAASNYQVTVTAPTDTTAPVVSVPADITAEATSAAGAVVSYTASATDIVDGAITPTCAPASGSTFALGTTPVSCSATDNAGNTGNAGFNVTVQDTTAPTLSLPANITTPATGISGAVVTYSASASDLVDGVVPVNCSPASGSTFAPGTTTVNCSATDAAGNTATGSFTITVHYSVNGFYQPVDMTPAGSPTVWNTVKNGSTVPLKFEVFAGSTELTDIAIVNQPLKATGVTCDSGTADDIELTATGGTSLRYDTTGGQFIYNWQTPKKAGSCYLVTVSMTDGSSLSAYFKLK
jgi:hypothetical protein